MHIASVHEEKKPFKCEICDKGFSQKHNMKIHVESVHKKKKTFKRRIVTWSYGLKIIYMMNKSSCNKEKKPSRWIGTKINEFDANIDYNKDVQI